MNGANCVVNSNISRSMTANDRKAWQFLKINCRRAVASSVTEPHMKINPDKETISWEVRHMISAHPLSIVITKVLSFALAAGVVIFVSLLLLTLRHA